MSASRTGDDALPARGRQGIAYSLRATFRKHPDAGSGLGGDDRSRRREERRPASPLSKLFIGLGGYGRLAALYPTTDEPAGERFDRDTVQFGAVRWRWCTTVIVSPEGLYVQARPPVIGVLPPMLIPWHEVTHVEPTRLYWQRTALLTIGEPAVVKLKVLPRVLAAMRPYLPTGER